MSTPTTQTSDELAAPAASNTVVANTATTATSSVSSASVVTSTVTTSSSPKTTISVGEYHKTRGKVTYASETLFDGLEDLDMEKGEEERDSSSSGRNEASVGTRRPREDDSDASSSKRSRSGSDRPLADAGALSTLRGGDEDGSTPSAAVTSRTNPVRDPWMPSPREIQSRYGSTTLASPYALYPCNAIVDDDVTKELDFDPSPDQRRHYYIGLFHELRFYGNKKHSRKSKVTEWEALCQSWGMFVENFNKNPSGYRERVRSASERYERYSKRPKILRLHDGAVEAGIPCAVPAGVACAQCQPGAVRLSERDINGYTGISVPVELKTLREKLITQLSSESAEGERNTQPRAVGDYSSRSSFTPFGGAGGGGIRTPSPFPERRSSGRSAAPTYRGQESILTNEYENEPDLGSRSDDQRFAGQSSEFPHVRLATGAAAVGRRHGPSPGEVWDRLEAVEHIQTAELAEIRQELKLVKARIGQAGQTASNIQASLGTVVARVEQRVSALEARIAPSHRGCR
ncbi:hypothetical protein PF002_g28324 [Phytophthora fragariae]|uniref:Uncharacterized protein n=1 Tax=Phytophthora fragariae TaxID=53985 RepID=A0A6A3W3J4_9STRA|nr:hypothetical protein PF003_g32134 [Phytophthora fragariae]KAE9067781.1 hypothetical protein PF007_g27939 [Phytophthora fragariae]KAE9083089.1 hypothetical protein PF006_g26761 [Phytophthora fragariae]KAE9177493.1 hypothetical protein PF002_g28324 [Phytophthora fragariae]KAE9266556.1 hypothetical protein PF001_g30431 [Phytophthora fragariae]